MLSSKLSVLNKVFNVLTKKETSLLLQGTINNRRYKFCTVVSEVLSIVDNPVL